MTTIIILGAAAAGYLVVKVAYAIVGAYYAKKGGAK